MRILNTSLPLITILTLLLLQAGGRHAPDLARLSGAELLLLGGLLLCGAALLLNWLRDPLRPGDEADDS